MIIFYSSLALFLSPTIFVLSVHCLPREIYHKSVRRQGRGIFVPEPKELRNRDLVWLYNTTSEGTTKTEGTSPTTTALKKWQVGRVSRKQYEIVNMIWRKTKVFLDVGTTPTALETSTIKTYQVSPQAFRSKLQTTESYIEFYYLEEYDKPENVINRSVRLSEEYIKNNPGKFQQLSSEKFKPMISHSPFMLFHVNVSPQTVPNKLLTVAPSSFVSIHTHKPNFRFHHEKQSYNGNNYNQLWNKLILGQTSTKNTRKRLKNTILSDDYKDQTCPLTTETIIENTVVINSTEDTFDDTTENSYTTIYDKIKFFEMYDRHTRSHKRIPKAYQSKNITDNGNNLKDSRDNKKVLLEHVDISISYNEGKNKFAKKLVNREAATFLNVESSTTPIPAMDNYFLRLKLNSSNYSMEEQVYETTTPKTYADISKAASWSEYSFAAVYIYEPTQILCDAAAISNHWLITAGSCLYRQHHLEPSLEGRSAFVTYCGAVWRQPERIAYVKYTLVHPKFNPRERSRRFLYNIGVIQVVSSLISACSGWAPISLMSHQFATNSGGSMASAVGWGLDRYAAKYPDTEIPTHPLKVYNGLVYSDDCPGNIGYSDAKQVEPLNVMRNVYCLSLPPYMNEENDPLHGSLLLVGGKLIALYLQEERRAWGEQSAQYTGVWRLIPWLLEVAREPEDIDAFTADI